MLWLGSGSRAIITNVVRCYIFRYGSVNFCCEFAVTCVGWVKWIAICESQFVRAFSPSAFESACNVAPISQRVLCHVVSRLIPVTWVYTFCCNMQYAYTGVRNGLCHQYGRSQDCIVSVPVVGRANVLSQFLLGGHLIVLLRVVAHRIYRLRSKNMEHLAIVFAVFPQRW
mgnify:CR=1 FL=1